MGSVVTGFFTGRYHTTFSFELADTYIATLDKFLMLDGKLSANFKLEEHFETCEGPLSFDRFYEALQKWGCHQKEIDYETLTAVEKSPAFMAL